MNLSGWNSASSADAEPVLGREHGRLADVAGEHPGPLHLVERPLERLRDRRLEQALAQADPQLAGEHLDDVLRRQRVGPREQLAEDRALARRPRRGLDRGERVGDLGDRRPVLGRRLRGPQREHVLDRAAEVGRSVVRLAERAGGHARQGR